MITLSELMGDVATLVRSAPSLRRGIVRCGEVLPPRPVGVPWVKDGDPRRLSVIESFPNTVVTLEDQAGTIGVGYVVGGPDVARLAAGLLRRATGDLLELLDGGPSRNGRASPQRARTEPVPGAGASAQAARAAVAMAAWDLLGHQHAVPCADLWGRESGRDSVPAYYSGFFTNRTLEELVAEAEAAMSQNFRMVKVRASHTVAEDVARVVTVASVYREPRSIAMDAVWGWSLDRAKSFLSAIPIDLLWLEDPFPYDADGRAAYAELARHVGPHVTAAGEACRTPDDLFALQSEGNVDLLVADVACLGGPMTFLEAAHALIARGGTVGSHLYSHCSVHLLAAIGNRPPVEGAAWQDPLFIIPLGVDASGRVPVTGPGLGATIDHELLAASSQLFASLELRRKPARATLARDR